MLFTKNENKEKLMKDHYEMLDKIVEEEYQKELKRMTIEEIRIPATHETEVCVYYVGEGILGIGWNEKSVSKLINNNIFHRSQIINIVGDVKNNAFSGNVLISYWKIVDVDNKVYEKVKKEIYSSNPYNN